MYVPIPGFSHLQLYQPADPVRYERVPTEEDLRIRERARALVRIAVEVAAGARPLRQIRRETFDPVIRLNLMAWSRGHGTSLRSVPCELRSLHARGGGEFFGSAQIGRHSHAFTGTFGKDRLTSFRLM